jgi:hypothetical protein
MLLRGQSGEQRCGECLGLDAPCPSVHITTSGVHETLGGHNLARLPMSHPYRSRHAQHDLPGIQLRSHSKGQSSIAVPTREPASMHFSRRDGTRFQIEVRGRRPQVFRPAGHQEATLMLSDHRAYMLPRSTSLHQLCSRLRAS